MQEPLVVGTDEETHQVTAIISHFIRPGREQGGCVAKTYQGQTTDIVCISLSSNFKNRFNKFCLRDTVPLFHSFHLSFSNHAHRFNPAQGSSRTIK